MNLDDFTFDEDTHIYRNGAGIVRPSVTQTLHICGVFDYSRIDPEVLERKRILGTNVHAWSAKFDLDQEGRRLDDIDDATLTDEEWGYAQAWMRFVAETNPRWEAVEQRMVRTIAGIEVGGTPDRIALIGRRLWVIDLKCAATFSPGWALQTADYEMMYTGHAKCGVLGRMAVLLTKDGKYRTKVYDDTSDAAGAVHMLGAATWKLNAGLVKLAA